MLASIHSANRQPVTAGRVALGIAAILLVSTACSSSNTSSNTAAALAIYGGNGQSGMVATSLSSALSVQVTDASGAPVSGVTVTFSASGGATLGSTTATTNSSGVAQTTVMLGQTAGVDTVMATAAGVSSSVTFTAQATAGVAATITIFSGNNQTATHGTLLASPLVVLVHDQYGNAVANATVTWTTAFGLLGNASTTTDSTGKSQTTWTLPAIAGSDSTTATLNASASVIFTATGS